VPGLFFAPLYVAMDRGFFKEQNIEISLDKAASGSEVMAFFEMFLERVNELFLDGHHAAANLAHSVRMVAARELVVRRSFTEVRGVDGA